MSGSHVVVARDGTIMVPRLLDAEEAAVMAGTWAWWCPAGRPYTALALDVRAAIDDDACSECDGHGFGARSLGGGGISAYPCRSCGGSGTEGCPDSSLLAWGAHLAGVPEGSEHGNAE